MEAAIAVGKDVEGIETNLNPLLSVSIINKEILLCIPGITFKNYQFVMTRVNNLQALSCLGLEECKALIGPEGKDMYAFFNTEISNI